MSRRLEMTEEVHDWLVELQQMQPAMARLAGEALLALLDEAPNLGPPMVVALKSVLQELEPGPLLDDFYQRMLEALQKVRRGVADVVLSRTRLGIQIQQVEARIEALGQWGAKLGDEADRRRSDLEEQLADLRRLHDELTRQEERITHDGERIHARVDAFRARKETVKASYSAARALVSSDRLLGGDTTTEAEMAEAHTAAEALLAEAREVEEHLREWPGEVDSGPGTEPYEMRLVALTGHDVRMLFTCEPPDTVVIFTVAVALPSVGESARGWWQWYDEASPEARELLARRMRRPQDTKVDYLSYSRESFLEAFFPDTPAEEMTEASARLVARNRVHPLVEVRRRFGLSREQVAERMNVEAARVADIEDGEPGATEIRDLLAYVEALGGHLEVVADVAGERIVIA